MTRKLANTVAFDDAPFAPAHRGDVAVVGAVCTGTRLDGLLTGRVRRDGANAAARLAALVLASPYAGHVQLVLLEGITLAGFNVVDLPLLHQRLGRPVLVVTRRRPNLEGIRRALLTQVPGGSRKWRRVQAAGPVEQVGPLYVQRAGLEPEEARAAVVRLTHHGHLPEPLRLAHLLARGLASG